MTLSWYQMMQVQVVILILITDILAHINEIEGVGGIRPQVTFDAMCKSPYVL